MKYQGYTKSNPLSYAMLALSNETNNDIYIKINKMIYQLAMHNLSDMI